MASRASKGIMTHFPAAKTAIERCVLCGRLTDILICEDIHSRKFYIEGAGQLCQDCYRDLSSLRPQVIVMLKIKRRKFSGLLHSLFGK